MPGARIYVTPGGFLHFLLNFGSAAPIDVEIMGFDQPTATRLAHQVYDMVRSTPGAVDVQISQDPNLPQLRVIVDRDKAGALGVNVGDVANTVATAIDGDIASLYQDPQNGNSYNILVRLNESDRDRIDDVRRLTVNSSSGQLVTLGNIASVVMSNSPVEIDRKYQQRIIDVTANVAGRDLGSVSADIQKKLNTIVVPTGFQVVQSGNIEQQNSTFKSLGLALLLAIIMVYMVMASQFQSLVDPFIIMFTIPLGVAGVVWALFLTNTTLSVTSFEGVIVMVGIVVSNGISADRLYQSSEKERNGTARSGHDGRKDEASSNIDDIVSHGFRFNSDGFGNGRRQIAGSARHRSHRWTDRVDISDFDFCPNTLHDLRRKIQERAEARSGIILKPRRSEIAG